MPNRFFTNLIDLLPFTRARAADVEANLTAVEAGFDALAAELQYYIKIADNVVQPALPAVLARKNKALIFGPDGVITLSNDDYNDQRAAVLASANNAATSATNAANSASSASTSASNASTSATNASTSATNAANSATSASNSANSSATSATLSQDWATKTASEVVAGQGFGAKKYATDAAASATTATNQASAASTSATNASTSATNASTSASNASTSATNAANSASAASTSATNAGTSETNANASLVSFKRQYLGAQSVAPTTRYDNTALQDGDLYFNTTNSPQPSMKVRSAGAWINAGSTVNALNKSQQFTATAGQTTFAVTGGYDANFIQVFLNGTYQRNGIDVTVTSGTNVVFAQPLAAGDEVDTIAFSAFTVANTYDQATIDAKMNALQYRNRIINGCLRVDQRGSAATAVTAVTASPFTFFADRFFIGTNLANKFSMLKEGTVSLPNAKSCMYVGVTTGAALAAGDYGAIYHVIEGINVQDSQWGTASAKAATLTFWAHATTAGTYSGAINNFQSAMSYPFTFTVATANTWVPITVSIPGCTTGTWKFDNSQGIQILWNIGSGSTYLGAAGAWSATNYVGATGTVQLATLSNQALRIGQPQFEFADKATAFEVRPFSVEQAMCQRYYHRVNSVKAWGYAAAGSALGFGLQFPVSMRASPSVTFANVQYGNSSGITAEQITPDQVSVYASATTTGAVSWIADVIKAAEL